MEMVRMGVRVESYSGYKANERPIRFYIGQRKLEVKELLDRWYGEDYDYFKLLADDLSTYVLKYHRLNDYWELVFYSAPNVPAWMNDENIGFNQDDENGTSRWFS